MTDREAQEIIRMVESNWGFDLGTARSIWREEFVKHDAEAMMAVVGRLARTRLARNRPSLADITELLRLMTPAIRAPEDHRHFGIPSWVYVWKWARTLRDPKLEPDVALPQQQRGYDELNQELIETGHSPGPDPSRYLTEEEYDGLHAEWVAVGSPRINPGAV